MSLLIIALFSVSLIPTQVPQAFAQSPTIFSCNYPQFIEAPFSHAQGFSLTFGINNPGQSRQIGLGVTLTSPDGQTYFDRHDDVVVQIASGYSNPSRWYVHDLPAKLNGGQGTIYSVTCAIWTGQPGASQWLGSVTNTIHVVNPFSY